MAIVTTTTSPSPSFGMPVLAFAPAQFMPEALVVQTTTKLGVVEGDQPAVYVPFIDLESDVGFVAEGSDIPVADPDLSQAIVYTGKLSVLVKASREQLLQEGITKTVQDEIQRAMQSRADWAFLNQSAPTGGANNPPAGLVNQPNTQDLGEVVDNLDKVIDAAAFVGQASGGPATHIIASPISWARVQKLKDEATSNRSLVGAGTDAAEKFLLSTPVIVSPECDASDLFVLNNKRVISAYGNVEVATSNDYFFGSDNVAIRGTFRFGAVVAKGGACVHLTIADPS